MISVDKVIKTFKDELREIYPSGEILAITNLVLEHYLGYSKTDIILKSDTELSEYQYNNLIHSLSRLKKHEPVQYILGETYFYNQKFIVQPGVLIPRPETEELVDWIIKSLAENEKLRVLDIGTGSGCIAISLAKNLKNADVTAFDVSEDALKIAKKNAEINCATVDFRNVNILEYENLESNQQYDIIVSNPPYVLENEKAEMKQNVLGFEPEIALFVKDNDPLLFYRTIVDFSVIFLKNKGKLYFEINEKYGKQVENLLTVHGFENIQLQKDINGKHRMISGTKIK